MITYPDLNPIAFHLGPLKVHWYGLMYALGLGIAWLLGWFRSQQLSHPWTANQLSDLILYAAIGLILGGRLGYVLFYNFSLFLSQPLWLFKIWEGGMSFHGGLLGGIVGCALFAKREKKPFFEVADFAAPFIPLGLATGRLGNFINGELWGRITTVPWGMVFPNAGPLPRHPSQLYEFFLEGILLFAVLWIYSRKPRPYRRVSAAFLIGYAVLRSFAECFREPDLQIGFIAFGWLTQGQLLSLPLFVAGILLWYLPSPSTRNSS